MPEEALTFAEATYDSMYGLIKSGWKRDGDLYTVEVIIPANTTAEIILPKAESGKVTVNGEVIEGVKEISSVTKLTDGLKLMLGSGNYSFCYKFK